MDLSDVFQFPVFPKFFPIPQLDIGKAVPVIMFQRCVVEVLILQEIIGRSADTPVTVAYENIAGTFVEG